MFGGSVKIVGDNVVITLPRKEIHGLLVALNPIQVGQVTSTATEAIRRAFKKALAQADQK